MAAALSKKACQPHEVTEGQPLPAHPAQRGSLIGQTPWGEAQAIVQLVSIGSHAIFRGLESDHVVLLDNRSPAAVEACMPSTLATLR